MTPITFSCEETRGMPPERIAGQIPGMARWPQFRDGSPMSNGDLRGHGQS